MTAKQVIAKPYKTVTNPALGVVMRIGRVTSVNIYSLSRITQRFIVVCCHMEPQCPQPIVHFDRLTAANSKGMHFSKGCQIFMFSFASKSIWPKLKGCWNPCEVWNAELGRALRQGTAGRLFNCPLEQKYQWEAEACAAPGQCVKPGKIPRG